MTYTLRPRQVEAVSKIDNFIRNSKKNNGIFVYPTAFGKALIISNLASKYPDKHFINITSGKELLSQNYEKYLSYGFEASLCSASLKSKEVGKVTFATISTLVRFIDFFRDKDLVIIQDECHIASGTTSQMNIFLKGVTKYKLVGLTATPFRLSSSREGSSLKMMNRDRGCIYKSIEDVVQIEDVVGQGYWSKLEYVKKEVDEDALVLNTTGAEYTDESLKQFREDNDINRKVSLEISDLMSKGKRSILVSVPFIKDAIEIAEATEGSKAIYSGMPDKERDSIIKDFKDLKLKAIVQCSILSVGFDHPQLDTVILAKPTNSLTFYYQLLGRGVRIHSSKESCLVVDFSGNYKKFGRVEDIQIENSEITKGWAVFSKDILITDYPLNTTNRPTKKTLTAQLIAQQQKVDSILDREFYFGKYKGKKVSQVYGRARGYLTWILDQKGFNWYGEKGELLKKSIQQHLGVYNGQNI